MKAKKVMYKGEEIYLKELAAKLNVTVSAICNRIKRGQSLDTIGEGGNYEVKTWFINGVEMTKKEICEKYSIHPETLRRNIINGTLMSCLKRAAGENSNRFNSKDRIEIQESTKKVLVQKRKVESKKVLNAQTDYSILSKRNFQNKPSIQKDFIPDFDPDYEPISKIVDKFQLKQSRVYLAMQSGKYTIKYYQIRGAKCGFILRTEIEALVLECRKEKEKAEQALKKNEPKKTLEELKKEHPLVTDERCFITTWFPKIESYFILSECNTSNPM